MMESQSLPAPELNQNINNNEVSSVVNSLNKTPEEENHNNGDVQKDNQAMEAWKKRIDSLLAQGSVQGIQTLCMSAPRQEISEEAKKSIEAEIVSTGPARRSKRKSKASGEQGEENEAEDGGNEGPKRGRPSYTEDELRTRYNKQSRTITVLKKRVEYLQTREKEVCQQLEYLVNNPRPREKLDLAPGIEEKLGKLGAKRKSYALFLYRELCCVFHDWVHEYKRVTDEVIETQREILIQAVQDCADNLPDDGTYFLTKVVKAALDTGKEQANKSHH